MKCVLVPVCDTADADWAAREAIAAYRSHPVQIHLINVQRPLPKHIAQFFSRNDLGDFHRESGMRVLEPVIRSLDEAGVPHDDHVLVGHQAETIVDFAKQHACSDVLVESKPKSMLSKFGLGSIGSQVMHLMQAQGATQAPASTTPGAS